MSIGDSISAGSTSIVVSLAGAHRSDQLSNGERDVQEPSRGLVLGPRPRRLSPAGCSGSMAWHPRGEEKSKPGASMRMTERQSTVRFLMVRKCRRCELHAPNGHGWA
jgi:hypothetical protein